ncbi:hypothetical protein ACFX2I_024657 [Malus domestica]
MRSSIGSTPLSLTATFLRRYRFSKPLSSTLFPSSPFSSSSSAPRSSADASAKDSTGSELTRLATVVEGCDFLLYPLLTMNELNFLFHCFGACLRPYKLFLSLHTKVSLPLTSKPLGCSIYISSSKLPGRNAVLTSNCSSSRSMLAAIPRITRMEVIFTTGEKISSKSTPFF